MTLFILLVLHDREPQPASKQAGFLCYGLALDGVYPPKGSKPAERLDRQTR